MNIVKKRAPRIDFTQKEEKPEPVDEKPIMDEKPKPKGEKPKATKSITEEDIEPTEPNEGKLEMTTEENIFNMGNTTKIPSPKKKKKKKQLSQKQLDHLARCREKALEKKKAMRAIKEKEKAEKAKIKAENKAAREAKALKKKEDNEKIRKSQLDAKRARKREDMFGILDEWYERKQKRKQASRTKSVPKKEVKPVQKTAQKPAQQQQHGGAPKFINEWKDQYCNSKFSPFNATFQRKTTRRGYMNY